MITYTIFLIFQRTHLSSNAAVLNNNLLRSTTVGKFIPTKRNKSDDGGRRPKTLELQNQLGNLPVPNINDTIAKFLITTKPLLNNEEFALDNEDDRNSPLLLLLPSSPPLPPPPSLLSQSKEHPEQSDL